MKKYLLAFTVVSLLAGCGGNDGSSKNQESIVPTGNFVAYNSFLTVTPGERVNIDLRNYVEGGKTLSSLTSTDVACETENTDNMSFSVKYEAGVYCLYDYTVTNEVGDIAAATLSVFATTADNPTLPPISEAMGIASTNQIFDLTIMLANSWQATYQLNTNSISIVAGENSEAGNYEASGNTITYNAPLLSGWNRILYTVSDSSNPEVEMIGTIYITLSDDVNSAPVISQPHYVYSDTVQASQNVLVDLAAIPDLTIIDDGDWRLQDVQSFTANVTQVDLESVTNKQFNFVTPTIGEHVVSYTVADQLGGFAIGLIHITVVANENAKTWTDLAFSHSDSTMMYLAAPTYNEASNKGFKVNPYWDGVGNTLATFTGSQADLYCREYGSVPKLSEMKLLVERASVGALNQGDFSAWPKDKNYLVKMDADASYAQFDLISGTSQALNEGETAYLSCLKHDRLAIETLNTQVVANGEEYYVVSVKKKDGASINVTLVTEQGSAILTNDVTFNVTPLSSEQDAISISGTTAGKYRFNVESGSKSVQTPIISLIGDATQALVDDVQAIRKDTIANEENYHDGLFLIANDSDRLEFTVNVKDINRNIIEGAFIEFSNDASEHIVSHNLIFDYFSDEEGNVKVQFVGKQEMFVESVDDVNVSFNISSTNNTEVVTVPVKHKNFLARIVLTPYEFNKLYIRATVTVLWAGEPSANTVVLDNSVRGSFLHVDGVLDFVSQIEVPLAGTEVILSTAYDGEAAKMAFEILGSPFTTELESDHIINRTTLVVPEMPSSALVTQEEYNATIKQQLIENDSIIIFRTTGNAIRVVDLPDFAQEEGDFIGKTVSVQNAGSNSVQFRANEDSYWTLDAKSGTTCKVRGFYWEGTNWVAFNPATHPQMPIHPTDSNYQNACTNNF